MTFHIARCGFCGYPAYLGECGCDSDILRYLHGSLRDAYFRASLNLRQSLSTMDLNEAIEFLKIEVELQEYRRQTAEREEERRALTLKLAAACGQV